MRDVEFPRDIGNLRCLAPEKKDEVRAGMYNSGTFERRSMISSAMPSAKYSWSFFSLMSTNGKTAIDLSLTTVLAAVRADSTAPFRLDSHNLSATK